MITARERRSLRAMKILYDSFFDLPLSKRILVDTELTPALCEIKKAIAEYKEDIRDEINTAVVVSGVNSKFTGVKKMPVAGERELEG